MRRGARAEGSATAALVVPGIRWRRDTRGYVVSMPATSLPHVFQVADLRVPFGRRLLLHDHEIAPRSEVGLSPDAREVCAHGDRILEIPAAPNSAFMLALEELLDEVDELEGELESHIG